MAWQPIATAPKDGRPVLIWAEDPYVLRWGPFVAVWVPRIAGGGHDIGDWELNGDQDPDWYPMPTHWMPAPEGPK
jgi:hypothetical protein